MTYPSSLFAVALLLCCAAHAQVQPTAAEKPQVRPLPQPSDLKLLLETQDGRTDFRLGEVVNLKFGYSSTTPGRYIHFQPANRYPSASAWTIQCEPAENVIDRDKVSGRLSAWTILNAGPSCGVGLVGGMGGSCLDCTSDLPVTEKAAYWFPFILNDRVQLMRPGQYSCTAKAADVRLSSSSPENPAVFELSSVPLKLNVNSDVMWSRAALESALLQLQSETCSASPTIDQQCGDAAHVVRFLDTEGSLKMAVRLFAGTENPYPLGQMWLAILQTSHPKLAIELLHNRLLDSDFSATENVLDTLVAISLREESPGAFAMNARPNDYHQRATDLLRNYVRELGQSLYEKRGTALDVSVETYKRNAAEKFCESDPLIPETEMRTTLAQIGR